MIKGMFFSGLLAITFMLSSIQRNNQVVFSVGDLSVIVNADVAPSALDMKGLRSVLKGEKQRWKDGTKITLAFMKTSTAVGSDMSNRIFGMTEKELNKYFLAQVFQGKMSSPEFFDSESDLTSYVKKTKGAISVVTAKSSSGFKTIVIDGKNSF